MGQSKATLLGDKSKLQLSRKVQRKARFTWAGSLEKKKRKKVKMAMPMTGTSLYESRQMTVAMMTTMTTTAT